MRSFKVLSGLLLLAFPFGSVEAQDKSPEYPRWAPADVKWSPVPSMPQGAQIAVLHGNPFKPGLFTVWIKLPPNYKLPVHSHPDERVRTIISGTYYSAVGESFDGSKLKDFPPGTFSHVPPKIWQFAETRNEAVVFQISGVGPTGITFLNPADDPRKSK